MLAAAVLVALCLGVAGGALVCVRQSLPLRRRLLLVMAIALGVRVALALVLHGLGTWSLTARGAVTPDEAVIDYAARLRAGGDNRSLVELGGSLHTVWLLIAASLYELWNDLLALKLLNAVLGTLLVVPAFLLARDLHSERAGVLAAWAVALFPNAVVWSALALREPLIVLVIVVLLTVVLRLVRGRAAPPRAMFWMATAVAALLVLAFARSYMVPLMIVLVTATGAVAAVTRRTIQPLLYAIAVGALAVLAVVAVPHGVELARTTVALAGEQAPSVYNPFSNCSDESSCLAVDAGPPRDALPRPSGPPRSAAEEQEELLGSLQSIAEKGVVRAVGIAVLAGRPVWRTDEFFFLLQPGVVVWWAILPAVVVGACVLGRRRRLAELALLAGFMGAVIVFLAYSGQFIRHHYMLEPVALVLAGVGTVHVLGSSSRRLRLGVGGACVVMAGAALMSVVVSLVQLG